MRKIFTAALCVALFSVKSIAQVNWSFETCVEESFIIGDQLPSFNPFSINDLANNSGARVGLRGDFSEKIFGRVSLGVVEAGRIGYYQTKLVPVEFSGGISFYSMNEGSKYPLNWSGDLSIGSSFVRSQSETYNRSGRNSLSENFGFGLSLDVLQTPQSMISIGYRHYLFYGDNLDALPEKGGMDQLSRWYVNSSFDISNSKVGTIKNKSFSKIIENVDWYTSVEESFVIGDQNSSLNLLNLSNAANNSGIRTGISANFNEQFGIEGTFGVVGSARLNGFSTNLIPVELLGRYSFYSMGANEKYPLTWNGEAGPTVALVRSQTSSANRNGLNSVSNGISLGVSLDILSIQGNTMTIGYRHTFYGDDNIDGLTAQGGVDQLSRWQLSYKINILSKEQIDDAIIDFEESDLVPAPAKSNESLVENSEKKSFKDRLKRNRDSKTEDEQLKDNKTKSLGEKLKPRKRSRNNTKAADNRVKKGSTKKPKDKKSVKQRLTNIRELNKVNLNSQIAEINTLEENISDSRFSDLDSVSEAFAEQLAVNSEQQTVEENEHSNDPTDASAQVNEFIIEQSETMNNSPNSNLEERLDTMSDEISELKSLIQTLLSSNGAVTKVETPQNSETIEKLKTLSKEIDTILKSLGADTDQISKIESNQGVLNQALQSQQTKEPISMPDFKEIKVAKKKQLSRNEGYAIILKTFDSEDEAQLYASKISGSLGTPFVWELIPLKKYRVVLGIYTDNYEMLYKVEELKYYGYSPWVTRWY